MQLSLYVFFLHADIGRLKKIKIIKWKFLGIIFWKFSFAFQSPCFRGDDLSNILEAERLGTGDWGDLEDRVTSDFTFDRSCIV